MFIRRRKIRIELKQTTLGLKMRLSVGPASSPAPAMASPFLPHALPRKTETTSTPTSIKGDLL